MSVFPIIEHVLHDLRYTVRALRQAPMFVATAVLTLTFAIAINVGIFATLNAIALRRLPAPRPHELVRLSTSFRTGQEVPFSFPMLRELASRQRAIEPLIASWGEPILTVKANGALTTAVVTGVTASFYAELGAVPSAGRLLLPGDLNLETFAGSPVAVIGYGLWQRQFGGNASAIGAQLEVEGVPFTIVGVAPRGFKGFGLIVEPDVTLPLTMGVGGIPRAPDRAGLLWLRLAGRLSPDVTLEQAQAQLDAVWPAIKTDIVPPTHAGAQRENFLSLPLHLESLATGHDPFFKTFTRPLVVLLALALAALLIGCVNLSSLMLRRIAQHETDRAVRMALGAHSWQAARHIVIEGGVIGVVAMMCALPLGLWASTVITRVLLPTGPVPLSLNTGLDGRVFAFAALIALGSAVLCGVLPAWSSTRRDPQPLLKYATQSGIGRHRLLGALVAGQLCLSVILVTNAGLLVRSLERALTVDLGFDSDDILRADFTSRPGVKERPDREIYYPLLVERVSALPGVSSVSVARMAPGSSTFKQMVSPMTWEPTDGITSTANSVTPGFFRSLGIRVIAGRDFEWADHARAPRVAILSAALARRLFPEGNGLGQRIRIGTQPYRQNFEVIGIVADARVHDAKDPSSYSTYLPELQDSEPTIGGWLIIRGRPDSVALQATVQSIGPDFVRNIQGVSSAFMSALASDRVTAVLAGLFGLLTLLLAAIGVGGLFAYTVALRTKEVAIRLALGAKQRSIVGAIASQGIVIALVGNALGLGISALSTRFVSSMLFETSPRDLLVLLGTPLLLMGIAISASIIPALRAAGTDPAAGLRSE
jgi:putative ABC transport system permease protein